MSGNVGCMSFARSCVNRVRHPKPYCNCKVTTPQPWKALSACACGEDYETSEWKWQQPSTSTSWVLMSEDQKQVTFHPFFSSGTASVRGDSPMTHNNHYYWEVKMLTETYGTDIMVGMCSDKVAYDNTHFQFSSLLGQDAESYGLSYTGALRHNSLVMRDSPGFCRGSIIGVRLDMWSGTLEFFVNRKSQGISFYNLRRHKALYPMLCSTAAQSCLKLIYASSWEASLQMDALKTLNSSVNVDEMDLPPGIRRTMKALFWVTGPEGRIGSEVDEKQDSQTSETPERPVRTATDMLSEFIPNQYVNGFYIDNVERNYRVVLWE